MAHLIESDGYIAKYAWPGGYPLAYMDAEGSVLCNECATKAEIDGEDMVQFANWEDPCLYCEVCSKRIESAYAEDEAQQEAN
jgi:hypothetical protein